MIEFCRRLSTADSFQRVVLSVIVFTAVLMGIETDRELVQQHYAVFKGINGFLHVFFIVELSIRFLATAPRFQNFFRNGWNIFDTIIVVLSLLPASGAFAMVGRLARLLRVSRLLSAVPELRLLVETMLRSIPSMGSIFLLLGVILYVYAVAGVHLFGTVDPDHWGTLGRALMTLFQVLTLEAWTEVMRASMGKHPYAWVYFVSFIVLAVFVVVNLFIAVVINNLESAKEAHRLAKLQDDPVQSRVRELRAKLSELEDLLRAERK
jgi:voltage-gated sodium channel